MHHAISKKIFVVLGAIALIASTQSAASATPFTQWATGATATSEYNTNQYAATEATGAPNSSGCDGANIWASLAGNTVDSLTVSYETAVVPAKINVYQNGKKGAVSNVEVSSNGTTWTSVYTGDPSLAGDGTCQEVNFYDDILAVSVRSVTAAIKYVRITVDQSTAGWAEIDAVELVAKSAQTIGAVAKTLKPQKSLTLPVKTSGALKITWKSTTKTICTVVKGKLVAKKKGTCKISGTNAGGTLYTKVTVIKTVNIK